MKTTKLLKAAFSLGAVAAVGLAATPLAQALNLTVVNQNPNYTDDQVYVRFQDVSCGGIQNNKSYKLSELPKPMAISRAGGRIFVSLGEPLQSNGPDFFDCPPSANAAQHHDYNTRWDKVEWTIDNSPTQCANLSSADFFSVPLQISNGSQTLKWNTSTAAIFSKVSDFAKNDAKAIHKPSDTTNSKPVNGILRVVAPSTVPSDSTAYPRMTDYIDSLKGKTTRIEGKVYDGSNNNYAFDTTFTPDGALVMTGAPTTTDGQATVSGGRSIRVEASELPLGGIYRCNPVANGNPAFITPNPADRVAVADACALRDVLAGLNFGFFNSPVDNMGAGPSTKWHVDKSKAYAGAQPQSSPVKPLFNYYASIIAEGGDSYGFPFTDTFVHKPLLNLAGKDMTLTVLPD